MNRARYIQATVGLICFLVLETIASAYTLQYASSDDVIRWDESCFHYSVHQDGIPGIESAALHDVIRASFDAWEDVDCSFFYFVETDDAACDDIGYVEKTGNMNLLIFRESDWQRDDNHDPSAIALTTTSWDDNTGRLLDADIEFNAEDYTFSIDGASDMTDLQNTATHEIGHMIGLDHSDVRLSTMAARAGIGETEKRTLAADDEEGLCLLYPEAYDPDVCKEPHCGLDLTCAADGCSKAGIAYYNAGDTSGCTASGPPRNGSKSAVRQLISLLLLLS